MMTDSRGKRVHLGNEIGRGGEATVHNVRGRTDRVAKIYQPGHGYPADKLAAMLAFSDQSLHNLCAWPADVLFDTGAFVGFLMPKIPGRRPVLDLYVPKLRLQHFPTANWRFLVHAAENTARAVHHIHQAGAVIGDVNDSNFLVADDATVRAIDTDSFQITAGNQCWLCRVGTGDYQPPEMQKLISYQGIVRTPNHDAFGLAVLIFKLLFMGRHPFSGRWKGQGDAPSIEDAIKAFRYAYSQRRSTGMQPPGDALSVDALPKSIRDLFEQAFDRSTTTAGRPTAEQWMTALQALGRSVRQCRINRFHWFYSGATKCPWCEIEQQSGAVLFGATAVQQPAASQPAASAPSQAPQAVAQPLGLSSSPPPAPQSPSVLLSRRTAGRLFGWVRVHRNGIAWVGAVVLIFWLASRQDTTPPTHPPPPRVTTPSPLPAPATPPSQAPATSRSPSPPMTASSPPASPVEASTPAPAQQPPPLAQDREKDTQTANLDQKLNVALAAKEKELQSYRSEFFGKLREVLANRPGIQIVGDRFVFQSEVLFPLGSADLTPAGQNGITALAVTIKDIASEIPPDLKWILRVDGHTDRQPIKPGFAFASNWELSAARAIIVVKLLIADGVPADRLAATAFGDNQPLDPADTPEAYAKNRRIELQLTDL
jgi:flagellar motor protein MotB